MKLEARTFLERVLPDDGTPVIVMFKASRDDIVNGVQSEYSHAIYVRKKPIESPPANYPFQYRYVSDGGGASYITWYLDYVNLKIDKLSEGSLVKKDLTVYVSGWDQETVEEHDARLAEQENMDTELGL